MRVLRPVTDFGRAALKFLIALTAIALVALPSGAEAAKAKKAKKPLPPVEQPVEAQDNGSFFDFGAGADETAGGVPVISPDNIEPLKAAIKRYEGILAKGGWIPIPALQMQVGTTHAAVSLLRRRLQMEGDMSGEGAAFGSETYFDMTLSEGVRNFQRRNGLTPTGDLMDKDRSKNGTRTVLALNVPAKARLGQLKANLQRIQAFRSISAKRYMLVNIPDQQVEAVENGKVVLRLAGVVGKPDRPSPTLTSSIYQVSFNPVWTLPPTVIKEDLIPKGRDLQRKGTPLLVKYGIDAFDGSGRKVDPAKVNFNSPSIYGYRFSQQPGKDNPLGFAKLEFGSPHSVYMHDTPSAKLFNKTYRAASSGCIRVENMEKLVRWVLKDSDDWSPDRIAQVKETGERINAKVKKGVPLYWVYVTAWASEDGVVHFRRDIYGRDQAYGVSKTASAY